MLTSYQRGRGNDPVVVLGRIKPSVAVNMIAYYVPAGEIRASSPAAVLWDHEEKGMSQQSHRSDPRILNRRTLQRDHAFLARVLRAGMDVLDVGCGTGAITAGIAKMVGPEGMALGIDRDDANLATAAQENGGIENLRFDVADILTLADTFDNRFDIVTAARTIQWISDPERAMVHMKKAAKPGSRVIILDYNLEDTHWDPEPPADFQRFYQAFLDWRTANHWDNRMASHLAGLFHSAGLVDIASYPSDEIVQRGDRGFSEPYAFGIWLYVIQTLGPKLVEAGFLEESVRQCAEKDYAAYVQSALRIQRHSMLTVEGTRPC
jgi:ubiquinone/menaquinone biosynthesis C-methylase UbiE